MGRKPTQILSAAKSIKRLREQLEARQSGLGILFVDLVGSSRLKHTTSQSEWLPVIAWFFSVVSETIHAEGGEVVKYIGDEVMAVFHDRDSKVPTVQMESCVWNIEKQLRQSDSQLIAKYALDFGDAAPIDFDGFPQDYLGTVVDRCARIGKFAKSGTALASSSYVDESKNPGSWKRVGKVTLRGFPHKESLYQLNGLGESISAEDLLIGSKSTTELMNELQKVSEQLDRCMSELKLHREK